MKSSLNVLTGIMMSLIGKSYANKMQRSQSYLKDLMMKLLAQLKNRSYSMNWESNDVYQEVTDAGQRALSVRWVLLIPWTENHLSSFKCGYLNIFSR